MNKQRGLSLVELMISITLGLMLMAGVVQMFVSTKSAQLSQQGLTRIQETGRMAMEFIGRDLRMAAAVGCVRLRTPERPAPNILDDLNLGGLHKDFTIGLVGYDSPADLVATGVTLNQAIGSMVPDADSDILVVRGATDRGFNMSISNHPSYPNTLTVHKGDSAIANNCIDGLCINGAAVVSDCDNGKIFKVHALAPAGTNLTITHNGAWDLGEEVNIFDARPEVFVYPLHTVVFFVAPGASGEPSLWQRIDRQTAIELVEGVERIQFSFRTAGAPSSDFVAASTLDEDGWTAVNAVRVDMVVRGAEANALETKQTYLFPGDAAATEPDDRRMRQLFTNTFSIRARNNSL